VIGVAAIPKRSILPSPLRRREAIAGYLFVLPWLISLLAFTTYPILAAFYLSFSDYNIIQPPQWVGLANFERMFNSDPSFAIGIGNSAYYSLLAVPIGLISSLMVALLLNSRVRGIGAYRTLYYLPSLTPSVASTIVFLLLFSPDAGPINSILNLFGIPTPIWFQDPYLAKPTLIILSLWGLGSSALIFLAGLKNISQACLEAAAIDGAGALQRFWYVTLPLLSPVILFNLVMGVIYSFQVFTQAFIIGGTDGSPLQSTLFYMIVIYRNAFRYLAMGYASALALLLFVAVLVVTLLIFRVSGRLVYYEGASREG
jgi:multiple sugar transport system permease protein